MQLIIDRFEGNIAVCEEGGRQVINIERNKLPPEAREGDVLNVDGDDMRIDSQATEARKSRMKDLLDGLF